MSGQYTLAKLTSQPVLKVRIPSEDLAIIRQSFVQYFDSNDQLWLFGSRVDDKKRGGDIDFYVETQLSREAGYKAERAFVERLHEELGEQKIDIVVKYADSDENMLIYRVAKARGVRLI